MPEIFSFTFSILEVMLSKLLFTKFPFYLNVVFPRVIIPILIIMLFCGADVKKGKVDVFAEFH